ncbi:unnamed protein product [Diabrotica balteata]|uniref:Pre-C2HC domain-containing protein n=1 Tax=Diabrotica balteata TaxID=107213 RepID=A0A9N9STA9_DIABA|nr:unnamed protein product [Diabrotica balteata]
MKRIKDKKQQPLFHVELVANANNKGIYKVNKLLNLIVEVEPPHPKREIPQCHRCQHFGHTHKYCKCVKCTANHLSSECPNPT